jgi:hypothetical protein
MDTRVTLFHCKSLRRIWWCFFFFFSPISNKIKNTYWLHVSTFRFSFSNATDDILHPPFSNGTGIFYFTPFFRANFYRFFFFLTEHAEPCYNGKLSAMNSLQILRSDHSSVDSLFFDIKPVTMQVIRKHLTPLQKKMGELLDRLSCSNYLFPLIYKKLYKSGITYIHKICNLN